MISASPPESGSNRGSSFLECSALPAQFPVTRLDNHWMAVSRPGGAYNVLILLGDTPIPAVERIFYPTAVQKHIVFEQCGVF